MLDSNIYSWGLTLVFLFIQYKDHTRRSLQSTKVSSQFMNVYEMLNRQKIVAVFKNIYLAHFVSTTKSMTPSRDWQVCRAYQYLLLSIAKIAIKLERIAYPVPLGCCPKVVNLFALQRWAAIQLPDINIHSFHYFHDEAIKISKRNFLPSY